MSGGKGGGLARAILSDPDHEFAVRALTRNARSAGAQELVRAGAEVIEADLDDAASVRAAFDGAHGAFVVTNYWAKRTPAEAAARTAAETELAQAEIAAGPPVTPASRRLVDAGGHPGLLRRRRAGAERGGPL